MCFSATASFVSGAALIATGAYLSTHKNCEPHQRYMALIPGIFGFQQVIEGIVWVGFSGLVPEWLHTYAIYSFSFFATSFWPAFIPLAVYQYEKSNRLSSPLQTKALQALVGMGFLIGIYLLWASTAYSELIAEVRCSQIDCNSIGYRYDMPYLKHSINLIYLSVIVVPFALSKNNIVRYLVCAVFFISFVLAAFLAKATTFPSIWCFLAAVMSICIVPAIIKNNKIASEAEQV